MINIELASSNLPEHNKRLNDVIIIRWNGIIESLHKNAINAFLFWHDQSKLMNGNIFETMKETRREFKHGQKLCKKIELQIKK